MNKRTQFELMIPDAPPAARTIPVTAAFDGAEIATIETGDERHVEKALETAYALYRDHDAWLPLHERIAIIERAINRDSDVPRLKKIRERAKIVVAIRPVLGVVTVSWRSVLRVMGTDLGDPITFDDEEDAGGDELQGQPGSAGAT